MPPMIQISKSLPWCSAVFVFFLEEHISKMEDMQATNECIYFSVFFMDVQIMLKNTFLGRCRENGASGLLMKITFQEFWKP